MAAFDQPRMGDLEVPAGGVPTAHSVLLDFLHPGKRVEYVFIESFNKRFRHDVLRKSWFCSFPDPTQAIELWRIE